MLTCRFTQSTLKLRLAARQPQLLAGSLLHCSGLLDHAVVGHLEAALEQATDGLGRAFTAHGIDPTPLRKKIADITDMLAREDENTQELLATWQGTGARGDRSKKAPVPGLSKMGAAELHERAPDTRGIPSADLAELIQQLTDQMRNAAAELQFEVAARLRDEVSDLKKELRQMMEAGVR